MTQYTYEFSEAQGYPLMCAQQFPWSVLQVVKTTPEEYLNVYEILCHRGHVAAHKEDHTFLIIHSCCGDQGGKYPERHINVVSEEERKAFFAALRTTMRQAVAWYHLADGDPGVTPATEDLKQEFQKTAINPY